MNLFEGNIKTANKETRKKGECWNDLKKQFSQRSILYYYQIRFFFGRYDRIKDIQEPVEHCKGHNIHWMFLGAQEKPQASTTVPVCEAKRYSHCHWLREGPKRKCGSGSTNKNKEGIDLNRA